MLKHFENVAITYFFRTVVSSFSWLQQITLALLHHQLKLTWCPFPVASLSLAQSAENSSMYFFDGLCFVKYFRLAITGSCIIVFILSHFEVRGWLMHYFPIISYCDTPGVHLSICCFESISVFFPTIGNTLSFPCLIDRWRGIIVNIFFYSIYHIIDYVVNNEFYIFNYGRRLHYVSRITPSVVSSISYFM